MDRISFQGRTNLKLDTKAYKSMRQLTHNNYTHISAKNQRNLGAGRIYSADINDKNIAVLIRNQRDGVLKYIPLNSKAEELILELETQVEKLKDKAQENLTAWIMGGTTFEHPKGDRTIKLINKIADIICDKPGIDTSILAAPKNAESNIIIHPNLTKFELIFDTPSKKDNLEKYFDIVELNNTEII
ncbi:hypothetical protein J6K35_06245 [bacterium]|nr:hypothetical protein [bacterium]